MRTAALVACALFASNAHGLTEEYVKANARTMWATFKEQHGKRYTTAAEDLKRFGVFRANMIQAAQHEAMESLNGARFGMNAFSDMTAEEFKVMHSMRPKARKENVKRIHADTTADEVDWRKQGKVTHVKNQGQCGSCWTFSTTGNIEGRWAMGGNTLTPVSEQEIVSCDNPTRHACNGGDMSQAMQWVISTKGGKIATEEAYPYVSGRGHVPACESTSGMKVGATIKSHRLIARDENELKAEVGKNGPVSIAVDANKWQHYHGGILENCCGAAGCRLDHGVLAVGFSTAGASKYWIIKNSWASSWGESGYIRIPFGENACGITRDAATVEI